MLPSLRKTRRKSQEDSSDDDAPRESSYVHVGLGHLAALGEASASLGLVSTLVLGICISSIVQYNESNHKVSNMFMAVGTTASAYSTTYSMLEYYYIQILRGLDSFMATRLLNSVQEGDEEEGPSHASVRTVECAPQSQHCSARGSYGILEDRISLLAEVEAALASFNEMRMWARNSMWLGLVSLIAGATCMIDPFGPLDPHPSAAASATIFFAAVGIAFQFAQCAGFRTRDILAYTIVCLVGCVTSAVSFFLHAKRIDVARFWATTLLSPSIVVVPMTVQCFRRTLLSAVMRRASIY